uniref:FH2 domain-containing protein n=1 Tax=Strigamia maritima TaxID=126957 RepID=T1JFN2_STRMM
FRNTAVTLCCAFVGGTQVLSPEAIFLSRSSLVTFCTTSLQLPKMPARRGMNGWCSCLSNNEPPEITYKVVENGGTVNLQALTPTQPIPDEEELNAKFAELVDELDLAAPKREAMFNLPSEKKWQIYCSRKKDEQETCSTSFPDYYIEKVNALSMLLFPREEEEVAVRTKLIDGLKTALRTQPNSFVMRFIDLDGLSCVLNFLGNMDYETCQSSIHTSIIGCVKALMNNSNGRAHVLAHPNSINIIAQSLDSENIKTKIAVLEILGAVCLVPGGHRKVLNAMLHYQKFACERTRFQTIISDLDKSTGIYRDEVSLKTAVMSFINAVLNYGPGQDHLEFRVHLRYEFLMLGIQPVIDKLRSHENATLDRHLDFFEMVRNEDEKEIARRFNQIHVDSKSATSIFDALKKKVSHTAAYPHFISLLQHFLLLPLNGNGGCPQHWLLCDRILQQVILQTEDGQNFDTAPININVKQIVHLLAKEEELTAAREKASTLERENSDLSSKLAKKEQECEIKTQEKEDMQSSLNKMKAKLEKETVGHLEAQQKIAELEHKVNEVNQQLNGEKVERVRLEQLVHAGSLPDDAKAAGLITINCTAQTNGDDGLRKSHLTNKSSCNQSVNSILPPPPGPPPPPAPGPPPMPFSEQSQSVPRMSVQKKNVPQPSNPLKSFNWSKIPDCKLDGTVWNDMDDAKLYKVMDLDDFDRTFSAYQRQLDGSVEDLRTLGKNKTKEFSVIDGRRAQNCTILLSKLKMSNEEICKAILDMDSKNQLPKDMVEQLLKFIPSQEEKALLDDHSCEIDQMARADRFLYEISRINHYEQKLRSLYFKKIFTERIQECRPKVDAVLEASKQVHRSKRLKKLLEVVLAFGNYMNRGQRGNASGFKLASLNRLADTKSSINRNITLLHYLIDTLEKKFKDTLKLEEDLTHVRQAAKVNLSDMEKDINVLKTGLQEVEKELEYHRKQPYVSGDRFVPVMKEFITTATYKFSELDDHFSDMKSRFERVIRMFGEDTHTTQPDEFFAIFDAFLTCFHEARQDNENLKRRKEDEERRAKQEAELKKRHQDDKSNGSVMKVKNGVVSNGYPVKNGRRTDDKGEFDDLISALRTGDVFGEDMAKLKRNRRRVNTSQSPPCTLSVRESSREREVITSKFRFLK